MVFFDPKGNPVQFQQWLEMYGPFYFLGGPTLGDRIRIGTQTSPFVENRVCALLKQTTLLSTADLILTMAWKIGLIDHVGSETSQEITYFRNWPTVLMDRYGNDFSGGITTLSSMMPTIMQQTSENNPQAVFDLHLELPSFGPVYILAVLFFMTHGEYPIYDRFAHVAAQAIDQGARPGSYISYKAIRKWTDYMSYMNLLAHLRQSVPQQVEIPSMFISRRLDRAMWVYGHFFETRNKTALPTKLSKVRSSAPVKSGSEGVLFGRIHDLGQFASDGWRRREIIIRQGTNGYPKESDCIYLIDSSGAKYGALPFIMGAGVKGDVCLGRPGALKPWFKQHYPSGEVKAEGVYFDPTGRPSEYRINSESEWKARTT